MGHGERAARYASAALGRTVDVNELRLVAQPADVSAAKAERVPMPTAGPSGSRAVGPIEGTLEVRHPLSGERGIVKCKPLDEGRVTEVIESIVDGLFKPRDRFLALWRLLPERLEPWMQRLPADTRIPDHTLIHHADIAAGIWASRRQQGACLSFALGPVQRFIEAARSVRDLWTGSALLSWLAFQAMLPVIRSLGPTAFVFPSLRGNPLMDLWLHEEGLDCVPEPTATARRSPSLPNRFVALVPWGSGGAIAHDLADECKQAFNDAWIQCSDAVRMELDTKLAPLHPEWDRYWESQVSAFFDVTVCAVPLSELGDKKTAWYVGGGFFDEVWPSASQIRSLHDDIPLEDRPQYEQKSAGRWQAQLEFSARVMEAQRHIRHVPPSSNLASDSGSVASKCSLYGSWEQMGPAEFDQSRKFWDQAANNALKHGIGGVHLREGERLCAMAMAKRFAGPVFLAEKLALGHQRLRFPDTATVAAAERLSKAGISPDEVRKEFGYWSGRWLHDADDHDAPPCPRKVRTRLRGAKQHLKSPPVYYAVLKMDGDDIGRWLRGDLAPSLRTVLHPKMVKYYEDLGAGSKLEARRSVGPALHASISGALGHFATQIAPKIVLAHHGTLIYCGGDDLLALLPSTQAMHCALALRQAFRHGSGNGSTMGMGSKATISAGITYVHYREDLRVAIQSARDAEHQAKQAKGKDRVHLRFIRRSGAHEGTTLAWEYGTWFCDRISDFAGKASSRWTYRLRDELPTNIIKVLPQQAVRSQIVRLGDRIEDPYWRQMAQPASPGNLIAQWWDHFMAHMNGGSGVIDPLENFILLCNGAAFVARGRDG